MRMIVAAMATCQSSVQSLPRRFGDTSDTGTAPAFNKGEQHLCAYDGGCELDAMRALDTKNKTQQEFLDWAEDETWKRPALPLRGSDGMIKEEDVDAPRTSVYSKPLNAVAVSKHFKYRQIGVLREEPEENDAISSSTWRKLFSADVRELVQEVLIHICGESCFRYSGKKWSVCADMFFIISSSLLQMMRKRRKKDIVGGGVASLCETCFRDKQKHARFTGPPFRLPRTPIRMSKQLRWRGRTPMQPPRTRSPPRPAHSLLDGYGRSIATRREPTLVGLHEQVRVERR